MAVLDCESIESTYDSIQSIFGISRQSIDQLFENLDVQRFYAENRDYAYDTPHLLLEKISELSSSGVNLDAVCWFHLTRIHPSTTFENGILPLGLQVDAIWDLLRSLVGDRISDDEWKQFRDGMGDSHSAHLYHMKVRDSDYWGPYGVLVRDVALCPSEVGHHDYLGIPEIVEDICLCLAESNEFDLYAAFVENSKPSIVKFIDPNPSIRCLPPAIYYLYARFHKEQLSLSCNTCFDGGAKPVPAEWIQRIDFPHFDFKTGRYFLTESVLRV